MFSMYVASEGNNFLLVARRDAEAVASSIIGEGGGGCSSYSYIRVHRP